MYLFHSSGFKLYSSSAYFLYPNSLAISFNECLKNGQRDKKTIFKKYSDIEELEDLKLLKDIVFLQCH